MPSYNEEHYKQAFRLYEDYGRNLKRVSHHPIMPTRATLIDWKKRGLGLPVGVEPQNWDEYLDSRITQRMSDARERAGKIRDGETLDVLEGIKSDVLESFYSIRDAIAAGDMEVRPSDMKSLVSLYLMLEDKETAEIEFKQNFAKTVLLAVRNHVDDAQFAVIRVTLEEMITDDFT